MDSETKQLPRILIIAGSDSSGGAGVQADLKTVTTLGGYGMTAITAITAQNTLGVDDVWPVPVPAVLAQAQACLSDIGADVIKTGMLGSAALIEALAQHLMDIAGAVPRVIDPVMVATSGDRLLASDAVDVLRVLLIKGAALVTPNAPEAQVLTGHAVEEINGQRRAAEALLEMGAKAALVKGGHIEGNMLTDVLQTEYGEWLIEGERVQSASTHGTGCTLASAIATRLGHGDDLDEAAHAARLWLAQAIRKAPGFGAGAGPINHAWQWGGLLG